MRQVVMLLAFIAAGVLCGRMLFDQAAPHVAMRLAVIKLASSAESDAAAQGAENFSPYNRFLHAPMIDETSRQIVRPAPDLVYSVCLVNFEEQSGARISAPPSDDYASMSVYAMNSDNILTINSLDPRWRSDGLELLLLRADTGRLPDMDRDMIAPVKGARAIVLQRRILRSPGGFAAIDAARQLTVCETF